VLRLP